MALVSAERRRARSRRSLSRRRRRASRRHRSVRTEGWVRASRIDARGQSGVSPLHLEFRGRRRPGDKAIVAGDARQDDAADRHDRDQRHGGGRSRAGSRSSAASSICSSCPVCSATWRSRATSSRRSREAGHPSLSRSPSMDHLHRVQSARSRGRRARPEKIALRRAIVMAYDVAGRDRRDPQRPGRARCRCRSRRVSRATCRVPKRITFDRDGSEHSCSIARVPQGRRRLALDAGRQAALDHVCEPERRDVARLRRALEKGVRRDRHPAHDRQGQDQRSDQGGARLPAPVLELRLGRRLPGRRQFRATPLQPQYRSEQRRLLHSPRSTACTRNPERCPTRPSARSCSSR